MTRDEIINMVLARVGRRESDSTLQSYAQDELVALQLAYERGLRLPGGNGIFFPWFLLSEIATATTAADTERISKPSKTIAEPDDGALWLRENSNSEWQSLWKDDYDVLQEQFPGKGKPKGYADSGEYWRLKPTPDQAYDLQVLVYKGEPSFASNNTNKWNEEVPELLLAGLGRIMAEFYLYNFELADRFKRYENEELNRIHDETVAREIQNRDLRLGGRSAWR